MKVFFFVKTAFLMLFLISFSTFASWKPARPTSGIGSRISKYDMAIQEVQKAAEAKENENKSVLNAVIERDKAVLEKYLIEGFSADATNENGQTALHILIDDPYFNTNQRDINIAELLLKHGANPELKAKSGFRKGESAFDAAKSWNHTKALQLIEQYYKNGRSLTQSKNTMQ